MAKKPDGILSGKAMKADDALDKKLGIKEGSKADRKIDNAVKGAAGKGKGKTPMLGGKLGTKDQAQGSRQNYKK